MNILLVLHFPVKFDLLGENTVLKCDTTFFSFSQPPPGHMEQNNRLLLRGYKARKRRKRAVVYELKLKFQALNFQIGRKPPFEKINEI